VKLIDVLAKRKLPGRVRKCAGLSAVVLTCHRDTWEYVLRVMSGPWLAQNQWDKDPSDSIIEKPGDESLIQVRLSGARLAELMMLLWYLPAQRRWWNDDVPRGMTSGFSGATATAAEEEQARRLYQAIAEVIDRVELNTPRQGDVPTVIIDDAVAAA
jgi:hypothetical protein